MKVSYYNYDTGMVEIRDLPFEPFVMFKARMLRTNYMAGVLHDEIVDACFAPDGDLYLHHPNGIVFDHKAQMGRDCEILGVVTQ